MTHFPSSHAKLRAVHRHAAVFRAMLNQYVKSAQNSIHTIQKPPRMDNYVVLDIPPIPDDLSAIIGDIVHNLRSALDTMAVDLAKISGADRVHDVYFPIAKHEQDYFAKGTQQKIAKLAPEYQKLINNECPFGDHIFVGLNLLAATDKHRQLIAASPTIKKTELRLFLNGGAIRGDFFINPPEPTPDEGKPIQHEILRVPPNSNIDALNLKLHCGVVFCVEPVVGEPVTDTLTQMGRAVKRVVDKIDAHCDGKS